MTPRVAILGLDPAQREWLDALAALRRSGEIELVGAGHRAHAAARDIADFFKPHYTLPAFDDLRLLLKETSPQILLMDRPPNATIDFLIGCVSQQIAIFSLGPCVESLAEAQLVAHALEPRSRLLYIWPRFADAPALRHAAEAPDYVRPIRFASAAWLGVNHALAKTLPPRPSPGFDLPVRSLSVLAWDALSTLIRLMEVPTSVYAAIRGTVGTGNHFADLTGAAAVTLRFPEDAAASITLSDRAPADDDPRRTLQLWGAEGTVKLTSHAYEYRNAEGALVDKGPPLSTGAPQSIATQTLDALREFLRHYQLPASPHRGWEHRLEDIAATMEALVVSHRTGQPESPDRLRRLRR